MTSEQEELPLWHCFVDNEGHDDWPSGDDNWRWEVFHTSEDDDGKPYREFVTEIYARNEAHATEIGRELARRVKCVFCSVCEAPK